jgi:uncharacterized protein (DUF1697 family)
MPAFIVHLRAVNVGGRGKLQMGASKRLCEKARIPEDRRRYRRRRPGCGA